MKKTIALILAVVMCLSMCACGGNATTETNGNETTNTPTESQEATTEATEPSLDILGEWVSVKDNTYTITFQNDGTCFYTGNPPTSVPAGSFVIDATITWNGTVSNTETTETNTPPETTTPEAEVNTYKYTFDPNVAIITIYTSTSTNYEVVIENGKAVIATVDGEYAFVRAENYEEYHAVYLAQEEAKKQEQIDNFYAEGKAGRTELEFGTAYSITDKLTMTVNDFVRGETADKDGKYPLFLHVTLANVTDQPVIVRFGKYNGTISTNSDLSFFVNAHGYGALIQSIPALSTNYIKTATDDDFTGSGAFRDALVIDANSQNDYYISIPRAKMAIMGSDTPLYFEPYYVILKFDNIEFFCDAAALEKAME